MYTENSEPVAKFTCGPLAGEEREERRPKVVPSDFHPRLEGQVYGTRPLIIDMQYFK